MSSNIHSILLASLPPPFGFTLRLHKITSAGTVAHYLDLKVSPNTHSIDNTATARALYCVILVYITSNHTAGAQAFIAYYSHRVEIGDFSGQE